MTQSEQQKQRIRILRTMAMDDLRKLLVKYSSTTLLHALAALNSDGGDGYLPGWEAAIREHAKEIDNH